MRRLALLLSLLALPVLAGCKGPCRELSEKLCGCEQGSGARESCLQRASDGESRVGPTAEQEATCEALLPKCDCELVDTEEGKRNCGLAR